MLSIIAVVLVALCALPAGGFAHGPASAPSHGLAVGPFPSWANLQRDYGVKGDGQADDTQAIQHALDDLAEHKQSCVLFIPAGIYRLTQPLITKRQGHTQYQGVSIIGDDPRTTHLVWDGAAGETMLHWDAWYSTISRLTFEGKKRAGIGVEYGPAFSTYNETSDLYFSDLKVGLQMGEPKSAGQAENEVLRCHFLRCAVGIETANWNSMDIWAWYCRFQDCGRAVYNRMGNWHVWQSLFLRSSVADLSSDNLMVFSVVNNTSVGSKAFFDFRSGHTWGSPVSITGNRVFDCTGDWAIVLANAGPYLIANNTFRLTKTGRAIQMTWGDQVLVENTYSKPDAVAEKGHFRRINEKVVDRAQLKTARPALSESPPRKHTKVYEVATGADADAIQKAIDRAARSQSKNPVVHLPAGKYLIAKTITLPAKKHLQLVGDGAGETATRLEWHGVGDGPVLKLLGPSKVTLNDFYVNAGTARGMEITNADQKGGQIFADQLNVIYSAKPQANSDGSAIHLSGLTGSNVLFRALQGGGNAGHWLELIGDSNVAAPANQISIFNGATGSAHGQYSLSDGAALVARGIYHEQSSDSPAELSLSGRGNLPIDASRLSLRTRSDIAAISTNSFQGNLVIATSQFMPVGTELPARFEMTGDGSQTNVLSLANQFWSPNGIDTSKDIWANTTNPKATAAPLECNINAPKRQPAAPQGTAFLENSQQLPGDVSPDKFIENSLRPLLAAKVWEPHHNADGKTHLQIHRVFISGAQSPVVAVNAGKGSAGSDERGAKSFVQKR